MIILVVLLLFGAGAFYYFQFQKPKNGQANGSMQEDKNGSLGTITGNLETLLARGVPMECTFSSSSEEGGTQGTTYINGQNMRADFTYISPDKTEMKSSMIRDQEYVYSWTQGQDKGVKITVADEAESVSQNEEMSQEEKNQLYDLENKKADYNCKPWVPNNAVFTPPTDIEFVDMNAQMQEMQKQLGSQCDTCNQLPEGSAREQCLSALNCN